MMEKDTLLLLEKVNQLSLTEKERCNVLAFFEKAEDDMTALSAIDTENVERMVNVLPMMRRAFSSSPAPREMENSGVPPVAKSAVNAAISVTTGNVSPTPVSAALPAPGIWPI